MAWNQYMALMMEKLNNLTASLFPPAFSPPNLCNSIYTDNVPRVQTTKSNKQTS